MWGCGVVEKERKKEKKRRGEVASFEFLGRHANVNRNGNKFSRQRDDVAGDSKGKMVDEINCEGDDRDG